MAKELMKDPVKPKRNTEKTNKKGWGKKIALGILVVIVGIVVALYFIETDFGIVGYGNVLSARDAVLRAGTKGPVEKIFVESGQRVSADDVIVKLDSEVERSEVARCQRELDAQEAELEHLKNIHEIERQQDRLAEAFAKIKLEDAEHEYERIKRLYEQNAASDQELQATKVAYDLAKAEHERRQIDRTAMREAKIEVQKRKIATVEAELMRAQGSLAMRTVEAPLEGVIVLHALSIGRVVDADEVLGQIFDDKYYQIVARLPEKYVPFLEEGQRVFFELSGYPRWWYGDFSGELYWISPVVTPHGSGDGTILVKARITDVPDFVKLKAGMSASVYVLAGRTRLLWKLLGLNVLEQADDGSGVAESNP